MYVWKYGNDKKQDIEKNLREGNMKEVQEITKELKKAKIVSIIGKVGTGKTTLATNIIKDFVTDTKVKRNVVLYSFESFSVALVSLISKITNNKLNVFINTTDFEKDEKIEEKISCGFFYLYDGAGMTIKKLKLEIDNLSKKLKEHKKNIDLIFIDYLQLTYPPTENLFIATKDKKGEELKENYADLIKQFADENLNKVAEENIKKLKEIAENYNIPIIVVTMLSNNKKKETEQRKIIHKNSDILFELERQENNSILKLTLPNKQTQNINVQFNETLCEFVKK